MNAIGRREAEELWLRYVAQLAWHKGNLDCASYDACLRASTLGVPAEFAIQEIISRIRAAGDHPRIKKIQAQWRRATLHVGANTSAPLAPVIRRPVFDSIRASRFADRIPRSVNAVWLKRRSPVSTRITPAEFLSAIFSLGYQALIFTDPCSQGQAVYQNQSLKTDCDALDRFVSGYKEGVWFLSNPVDGQYHHNPRQDSQSRRSEGSIMAFLYAVLEKRLPAARAVVADPSAAAVADSLYHL